MAQARIRIVHVFRAPVGGLFRHVADLAREQIALGHDVGLIADSTTGGDRADEVLAELEPRLTLGVARLPMRRPPGPADLGAALAVARRLRALRPDVIHGHGAKGGLYARLSRLFGPGRAVRVYTPHGGSLNYNPGSREHAVYMAVERALAAGTDLLLFESAYIGGRYEKFVGSVRALKHVIVNGVSAAEMTPVFPGADAADLVYVGELRAAKGIDTLLDALPTVAGVIGRMPRLVLVGSGPDEAALKAHAARLGVADHVRFAGAMPARAAFALGSTLVVPSRAESLPYVVLEAAAASMPMVATNVGGIPEIFGPCANRLFPCDDPSAMASRIVARMSESPEKTAADSAELAAWVGGRFTLPNMVEGVLAGYREALAARNIQLDRAERPSANLIGSRG